MLILTRYLIALGLVFLSARAHATEVKIGLMASLTGNDALESKGIVNAAKLAVEEVNRDKSKNWQLVIEDTKSNPVGAKEAYENLLKQKVIAVIAPYKSAQIVAMIPAMEKGETPTFIGGTNPRLTEQGKWFLRLRHDDTISASAMVRFIKETTKLTKIGILHDNGAFGTGGANLASQYMKEAGLTLTKRIGFELGQKNYDQAMDDMKKAGVEALIVYSANQTDGGLIAIPYAKIGKPFMYIASPSAVSKVALDLAGAAAEGIYGVTDFVYGTTEQNKKYEADYIAEYHEKPDQQQAYMYDAVKITDQAISAVGADKIKIRHYVLALKNYPGVLNTYRFTANGDGVHSISVVKIQGGKPILVKEMDKP